MDESDFNIGQPYDPNSFNEAISCSESESWLTVLKENWNQSKKMYRIVLIFRMILSQLVANGSTNPDDLQHDGCGSTPGSPEIPSRWSIKHDH